MANRYWVGGTGDWGQTSHWSTSSGGSSGASLPNSSDDVYFDANSFSGTGQVVTISAMAACRSMDWTGATHSPTLRGNSASLSIWGSLTLIGNMTYEYSAIASFASQTTGNTITTNGLTFSIGSSLYFEGVGGEWTLQDDLSGASIYPRNGTLNTNDKDINCNWFSTSTDNAKTINLGASIITCTGDFGNSGTFANLTLNTGTSRIILENNSKFFGNNKTFFDVEFQGNITTVIDSCEFNDLKFTAGKTVNITAGTTQTFTSLSGNGTLGNLIVLQSTLDGSPFILNCVGTVLKSYYSIKDCIATGVATFKARRSVDRGGNTGWIFNYFSELDLITSEHRDKPNFINWLTAYLNIVDDICVTVQGLDDDFDVDNAVGLQLDIIGAIVGVNRNLSFQPSGGASPTLDDDTYRFLVKAKIAQNHWKGTIPELYTIWNASFPGIPIKISDGQDMSFTVLFVTQNYSTLKKELITNGYIIPKPQGVSLNYYFNGTFSFRTAAINSPYTAEIDTDAGFSDITQATGGYLGAAYLT